MTIERTTTETVTDEPTPAPEVTIEVNEAEDAEDAGPVKDE